MQAYIDYLKSNFEDVNIIFIDFMDLEFEEIKEYHTLFYTLRWNGWKFQGFMVV